MTPIPFNLAALKDRSFLQLDDAHTHLVAPLGGKKPGLRDWKIHPASLTPGQLKELERTVAFGDVTIVYRASQVSVRWGTAAQWNTNVLDFAGTPKLHVTPSATEVLIELSGARFAGLQLSADFTARLTLVNGQAQMELRFPFCGFRATAPLAPWLDRVAPITAAVFWDDDLCRITDGVHLRAAGVATAQFHPGWLFVFAAKTPFVTLASGDAVVAAQAFALAPLAKDMPHLLPNPARRRSAFFVPEQAGFRLPLWPERSGGWAFRQPAAPFRWLLVENHEETGGDIRRGLLAWGRTTDELLYETAGGLRDTAAAPFALHLALPIHAAAYAGDGRRLGSGILAVRPVTPVCFHTERCTMVLGPVRGKPLFCLLDLPATAATAATLYLGPLPTAGTLKPGLEFSLVSTALRPQPLADDAARPVVSDPFPPPRPSTVVLSLGTLERAIDPTEGKIELCDAAPAHLVLPEGLITQLIRPTDLMVLDFWFHRARPTFDGAAGSIRPGNQGAPKVVVILPPQSIGEETFIEDESNKNELPVDPVLPLLPVMHRTAAPSRLAFAFPTGVHALPFTLKQLLDWSEGTMKPSLDGRALHHPEKIDETYPPDLDHTVVEAPYRLLISPDQHGVWRHVHPSVEAARAVPWMVRLAGTRDDSTTTPPIRAIFSVDLNPNLPPSALGSDASLIPDERKFAVQNCTRKAVEARRLMLSALGAWLDFHGDWKEFEDVTLERWLHRSTLGRDQYVETVMRGYLFPFGHKAALVTISERKFGQRPAGRLGAWLRKRSFLVVREAVRDYADDAAHTAVFAPPHHGGRELPFRQVRLVTRVTPLLDEKTAIAPGTTKESNFWPQVLGQDFFFNLSATDWAGRTVGFCAPLAFVRYDTAQNAATLDAIIANQKANVPGPGEPTRRFRYLFHGQPVAFAAPAADASAAGNTTLEVASMDFAGFRHAAWGGAAATRPAYPELTATSAVSPLHRQFAASALPSDLVFHDAYLSGGFQTGGLFLRYRYAQPCAFGAGNPSDKVGGVVTPGMNLGGISQLHGLVGVSAPGSNPPDPAELTHFDAGQFDPKKYFGGVSAKLLGGLELSDLLGDLAGAAFAGQVPRWLDKRDGTTVTRTLSWTTNSFSASLPAGIEFGSGASLTLDCVSRLNTASGDASAHVSAKLSDFAISLFGIIKVPFERFNLDMDVGRKPEVDVAVGSPEFDGALGFLSELEKKLGLENFADPPSVDITTDGISIGYTLAIPTVAVGVFSLQNLAISTSATLPFNGDPFRMRFAISERQNPFLITVSLFTGGGFFALSAGLDGVDTLEIALEFGGSFTLDIGIATGGAYLLAGFYFKVDPTGCVLTGYIRAGGELDVLGLISISCEFYLGLTYESSTGKAWGEASMTVEISVLFFSFDVTLTVRREFAGDSSDPTFGDTIATDDWTNYNLAFAD